MANIIRQLAESNDNEYKRSPAGDHFKNFQNLGFTVQKKGMISIKSSEKNANLQLTLAKAADAGGNSVLLLDTDMDENGEMLAHFFDAFFVHKFTGGTHPYDIHDWLLFIHKPQLGYTLM